MAVDSARRVRRALLPKGSECVCVCACSVMSESLQASGLDSLPGSSVHGILQAKILEWVGLLSSNESSPLRDQTLASYTSCISRQVLYH